MCKCSRSKQVQPMRLHPIGVSQMANCARGFSVLELAAMNIYSDGVAGSGMQSTPQILPAAGAAFIAKPPLIGRTVKCKMWSSLGGEAQFWTPLQSRLACSK